MNELLKQRLQFACIGFNLTLMLYMLVRSMFGIRIYWSWYASQAGMGALLGILVASVVFVVVGKLQR